MDQQATNPNTKSSGQGKDHTFQTCLKLARQRYDIFIDDLGEILVCDKLRPGARVAYPLGDARDFLVVAMHKAFPGRGTQVSVIDDVMGLLAAETRQEQMHGQAARVTVHKRTAHRVEGNGETIYIDLGTDSVVRVTPSGWSIVASPDDLVWHRPASFESLPHPIAPAINGDLSPLASLLPLPKAQVDLFAACIIASWHQQQQPVLHFEGPAGKGKSWAAHVYTMLADPHSGGGVVVPKSAHDFALLVSGRRITHLDNLPKALPDAMSDLACVSVTHGSFSTRTLYADRSVTYIQFAQGTQLVLTSVGMRLAPDLSSRTVTFTPNLEERTRQSDLLARFNQHQPAILGALLDRLVKVLAASSTSTETFESKHRLMDFDRTVTLFDRTSGAEASVGLADSIEEAKSSVCEESLLPVLLDRLLHRHSDQWTGIASGLLAELVSLSSSTHESRSVPASPKALVRALRQLAPSLLGVGISYEERTTGPARLKTLKRVRVTKDYQDVPLPGLAEATAS